MSTKPQHCLECAENQFILSQAQQQLRQIQQENEALRSTLAWRRIRTLSNEVQAGHQRFNEAKAAVLSILPEILSEILSDFDAPRSIEKEFLIKPSDKPLKRVFAIAIDEEIPGENYQRKKLRPE